MKLSPEQKHAVAQWLASGESLSTVQKRLAEEFQVSLTYMEVRFLVDDLGLEIREPAKRATSPAADLSQPAVQPGGPAGAGGAGAHDAALPAEDDLLPQETGGVSIDVDAVVRPGLLISGSASFSDGQSAKWGLDQYGRLMFEPVTKGYRPSQADVQEFQIELQRILEKKGLY